MRTLHIVLTMAGRGSRFANAGYNTPKPLIPVDGQPMFLKALSSLDHIEAVKRHTIIIRAEHDTEYSLESLLKDKLPSANIVKTAEEPIGATVDALRSQDFIQEDEGIILLDCDLWFESESYDSMVTRSPLNQSDINGGLLTFTADNPRYSYAKFGEDHIVTETAEKRVISNNAVTGAYYFAHKKDFVGAAQGLLSQPRSDEMPEYYISPLYNVLIQNGGKIEAATVDAFASFGTPEELTTYNAQYRQQPYTAE